MFINTSICICLITKFGGNLSMLNSEDRRISKSKKSDAKCAYSINRGKGV